MYHKHMPAPAVVVLEPVLLEFALERRDLLPESAALIARAFIWKHADISLHGNILRVNRAGLHEDLDSCTLLLHLKEKFSLLFYERILPCQEFSGNGSVMRDVLCSGRILASARSRVNP